MIAASKHDLTERGRERMITSEGAEPTGAESGRAGHVTGRKRPRKKAPSCQSCFFGCRGLCALELGRPCATYRPDGPDGLAPPRQPELLMRAADDTALAA
jgi:hypothetical protein